MNLLERAGLNDCVWPTQETIGRDTNVSPPTVRKGLGELEAAGFVVQRRRGQGLANVYSIRFKALEVWANNGSVFRSGQEDTFVPEPKLKAVPATNAFVQEPNASSIEDPSKEDPKKEAPKRKKVDPSIGRFRPGELENRYAYIQQQPYRDRAIQEARARADAAS
jgi:hypothetical protein